MTELLQITLSIIMTIIGAGIQQLYNIYKMSRFNLARHPLFTDIEKQLNNIHFWETKENRQVFIDALRIKLNIWLYETTELIDKLNNTYTRKSLEYEFTKWASNTINKYNTKWEQNGIDKKIRQHINKIHQPKVDVLLKQIIDIINDKSLPKLLVKRNILTILQMLLIETIADFKDITYRTVYNGEFKDIYYKNIPINDEQYEEYNVKQISKEL